MPRCPWLNPVQTYPTDQVSAEGCPPVQYFVVLSRIGLSIHTCTTLIDYASVSLTTRATLVKGRQIMCIVGPHTGEGHVPLRRTPHPKPM